MTTGDGPSGLQEPPARTTPRPRIGRRLLLGGAVTIGVGAAAAGVLASPPPPDSSRAGTRRPDWWPPTGSEQARIAQLLRRATLGFTAHDLETAFKDGFDRTLERLIEAPAAEPPKLIPDDDPLGGTMLGGDSLQKWWVQHMLSTPTPFAERMTFFWHGHFTSGLDKVEVPFMYWQNLTWRRMALGRLDAILRQVTVDPAMLLYLDLADSDASDPAQPPNENYARELMELFTMGPGNYTEADVKAAARALAGWTTPPPDGQVEVVVDEATGARDKVDVWRGQKPGIFVAEAAYGDKVTFLGRTGRLQLPEVIERILASPATAPFLARKVATAFISPRPQAETVRQIADGFRRSGYDVKALMRTVFTSPEFTAGSTYRSLVRSPLEFMLSAVLALGAVSNDTAELVAGYGDPTGQSLFLPPNVAGWPSNGGWISPSMLLARFNFASQLLDAVPAPPPAADAARLYFDGVLSKATAARLEGAGSDRERWLVILTSPEFNLK